MKTSNYFGLIACFILLILLPILSCAQDKIKGILLDDETNEPLIGASVIIKGTTQGTTTNEDGKFELEVSQDPPIQLQISYVGYATKEFEVKTFAKKVKFRLLEENVQLEDVEIIDSRLTEKLKESPVTVEYMDIIAIRETPSSNFYDGLGLLKGVDLTSASLGFKIINTRGFNSTSPVRSLQLIDGVDNQAPGLSFSLGNFLGTSEIDLQKVEIIAGANSALYGPNAFNGVINMTTKNPFIHKGLTVMVKGSVFLETAIRYADVIKNKAGKDKFAYKFNMYYLRANDFEATNYDTTAQSLVSKDNWGGYDAINIYGDENLTNGTNNYTSDYGRRNFPGLGIYYRTGYKEVDLVDYDTENLKLAGSMHYKLTHDIEALYAYNFGSGTTVYQGDNRYSLKNIQFQQHRIEIKKPGKFYIKAYRTHEDAGDSYDAVFTALLLQQASKSNSDWGQDYSSYYLQNVRGKIWKLPGFPNPQKYPSLWFGDTADSTYDAADKVMQENADSMAYWHQQARDFADEIGNTPTNLASFEPGTERYDSLFKEIISKTTYAEGGSKFFDRSSLSHIQAEYKFTPRFMNILIGGNYRKYNPKSNGTIFSDTNNVLITNSEFGFYSSLEKRILREKLILTSTTRLDKNENFDYLVSPAVSAVYLQSNKNAFRLSFSSAIRNPTLQDQFLYYNVGRAILLGNVNGIDSILVTINSLFDYYNSLKKDTLVFFDVPAVRPEKVKTIEVGYKGSLVKNIFIDASYYHSWYRDFIGYKIGATSPIDTGGNIIPIQFYRVTANSSDVVTTQGFSIGLNYFFKKYYAISGNHTWNIL
ncbi:MAG: carboxypeptidase-like regulatory domain-containing protein, partial [Bacteroidia bacterium]|nr:carboxypeptidase-like regulatory domain-containing protein [Bacteroidia bacterium]